MPFATVDYTPPALPDLKELRTIEDIRAAITRIAEYLQRLNATHIQYFMLLKQNLNESATTQGADLASVDPLSPTNFMHMVTGSGTVTTINTPLYYAGQLMLFAQDGFYLASGGNISLFQSPNYLAPGAHIMLTYVPTRGLWFADTCRLKSAPGTLNVGGRIVSEP